MGNFHTTLSSAYMIRPKKNGGGLHRVSDPGAGAISSYHGMHFKVVEPIARGMEIFISYGEQWLQEREGSLGKVPLKESYERADLLVAKFHSFIKNETMFDREASQKVWTFIRQELTFDQRVTQALPDNIEALAEASEVGTAIYSLSSRPYDWLQKNGSCVDKIGSGHSSIQGIGMGAFARTSFSVGDLIATTPLIHVSRNDTIILKKTDKRGILQAGHQLLLNYCYGHSKSSLLLLPYAPVVNYINHNIGQSVNARLQWSSFAHHKSDWLERTVSDILKEPYSGLFLDIIATKDLKKGEEIFLDYGLEWQTSWDQYFSNWSPKLDYISAFELEKSERKLRTKFEQQVDPYPSNVLVVCFVPIDIIEVSSSRKGIHGHEYLWYESAGLLYYGSNGFPCDILSRTLNTESTYIYSADVFFPDHQNVLVGNIPREFINFVDKPYSGDEYMESAFRHEIQIPDDIFPRNWMDL